MGLDNKTGVGHQAWPCMWTCNIIDCSLGLRTLASFDVCKRLLPIPASTLVNMNQYRPTRLHNGPTGLYTCRGPLRCTRVLLFDFYLHNRWQRICLKSLKWYIPFFPFFCMSNNLKEISVFTFASLSGCLSQCTKDL